MVGRHGQWEDSEAEPGDQHRYATERPHGDCREGCVQARS
jgi:hypothetical protein